MDVAITNRHRWRHLVVAGLCGVGLAVSVGATAASADGAQQQLTPDPDAYCVNNASPYSDQVRELGWTVLYTGLRGTPSQNDWACTYTVYKTVPIAGTMANDGSLPLPPSDEAFPIDWAAMCGTQYDGSTEQWVGVPGPVASSPGPFGAPWLCLGAAGATYDQTETPDGPIGRTG